jgi:hypothetical protein
MVTGLLCTAQGFEHETASRLTADATSQIVHENFRRARDWMLTIGRISAIKFAPILLTKH